LSKIRKDYFSDKIVFITNEKLGKINKLKKIVKNKNCSYCPGNESLTELADPVLVAKLGTLAKLSDEPDNYVKNWTVRVFPSNKAIVSPNLEKKYSEHPQYSEPASGYHYIVVLSQKHTINISDIDGDQWTNVLTTVQDKARWLYTKKNVSYVAVFMNHGSNAGAKLEHPHLQVVSLPTLPSVINSEAKFIQKPLREKGICAMCDIIKKEENSPRHIITKNNFVVFTPWASFYPYEFWICPKNHDVSVFRSSQKQIADLSEVIQLSLKTMVKTIGNVPFNLIVYTSPEKKTSKQIHWRIEIYPRINDEKDLEIGTKIFVNKISPEFAAKKLKKKLKIKNN